MCARAQEEDPDTGPLLSWVANGSRPQWDDVSPFSETLKCYWAQWDSLRVKDGVLYRLWESPAGDRVIWQLVLPKQLQKAAFKELHGPPSTGHFGVTKTLGRVRERFYWARCHQDIQAWCASCDTCAAKKGPPKRPKAPLSQYNVGAGVPKEIHSDQGRNFESILFKEMCDLLGTHKTRTTLLHPQSDGLVERYNRTLTTQLAMYVDEHQRDWDEHVPLLLLAYRSAIQESTKASPASLMFGRELRLPIDLLYQRPEEEDLHTPYVEALQERMDKVHDYARNQLQLSSDRMKRYHDVGTASRLFDVGDPVWLYNPRRVKGLTPKLQKPWEGPYTVLKRINDLVYRIQLSPRTKPKVVHLNRLWRYRGEHPPAWFKVPFPDTQEAEPQLNISDTENNTAAPQENSQTSSDYRELRRSGRNRHPPERYGLGVGATRDGQP